MKTAYLSTNFQQGVTLVELLLVIAISGILFAVVMVNFTNFKDVQTLQSAAYEFSTTLQTARTRTAAQVIPTTCIGSLQYYQVAITGSDPGTYEIDSKCTGDAAPNLVISSKKTLPTGTSFATPLPGPVIFDVITGHVESPPRTITIKQGSATKQVTIDAVGNISTD